MKIKNLEDAEKWLGTIKDEQKLTELVKKGKLEKNQAKKIRPELIARQKIHSTIRETSLW